MSVRILQDKFRTVLRHIPGEPQTTRTVRIKSDMDVRETTPFVDIVLSGDEQLALLQMLAELIARREW